VYGFSVSGTSTATVWYIPTTALEQAQATSTPTADASSNTSTASITSNVSANLTTASTYYPSPSLISSSYVAAGDNNGLKTASKVGITVGVLILLAIMILATFLFIRRRRRRGRIEKDRVQAETSEFERSFSAAGLRTRNIVSGAEDVNERRVDEGRTEGQGKQTVNNLGGKIPSLGSFNEGYHPPVRGPLEDRSASHSQISIPENPFAMHELDNNKYRLEDFDLPKTRVVEGMKEVVNSEEHNLKVLRNRIDRIREEKERLERIQELEKLERQTRQEIIEAQRRAGTG
jgi:hypothetical protein